MCIQEQPSPRFKAVHFMKSHGKEKDDSFFAVNPTVTLFLLVDGNPAVISENHEINDRTL